MVNRICTLAVCLSIITAPAAWSADSITQVFKLTVTIPPHVMQLNIDPVNAFSASADQSGPDQMTQEQMMVRDHRDVLVRSIVLP